MSATIRASSSANNSSWGVGGVTAGATMQDGGFSQSKMLAISDFSGSYGLNVRGFTAQLQSLQQADLGPRQDVGGAVRGLTNFIRDAFGPSAPSGGPGSRPASWSGGRHDASWGNHGPRGADDCHRHHGQGGPAGSSGASPSSAPSGSASGHTPAQNASYPAQPAQNAQPAQARRNVNDPMFLNALSSLMQDLGFSDKAIQSVAQALKERDPAASAHSEHTVPGVYAA